MSRMWLVIVAALALGVAGCEDEPPPSDPGPPGGGAGKAGKGKGKAKGKAEAKANGGDEQKKVVAAVTFTDEDFVESEHNRDPFRSFAESFVLKAPAAPQRLVLMPDVSVEQMRLIAIVTGADKPRAMLVDPKGVGHVAARGDFLGRPEVVQTGGRESLPVTLNWRVDRIRPSEVVLAREDPSSPNRVPLTLVLSLHDDDALEDDVESSLPKDDVREFEASDSTGG